MTGAASGRGRADDHATAEVLVDGLCYPECPRWHEDQLVFSDQYAGTVHRVGPDGSLEVLFEVPGRPAGLGWLPDGTLVVASMLDRSLWRWTDGVLELVVDLGDLSPGPTNEVLVGPQGRTYIGNIGFDFYGGADVTATHLIVVDLDGTVRTTAEDLVVPNGMALTPDGVRLVVAESFGHRLTSFAIDDDGLLVDRRVFADLGPHVPDGIALDAEGGVWFASVTSGACHRVLEGGRITHEVRSRDRAVFACALGGPEGTDLHLCTSRSHDPDEAVRLRSGAIEVIEVEVPRVQPPPPSRSGWETSTSGPMFPSQNE